MNIDKIINILITKYKLKKYENNKNINIYNYIFTISNIMKEYIIDNINQFIFDDNYSEILDYTYEIILSQYFDNNYYNNIHNLNEIKFRSILFRCCLISRILIFKYFIPIRSYNSTFIRKNMKGISYNKIINFDKINAQLEKIKSIKQPEQRTDEWYTFRNSTLTASNIWKIFISDYSQTQLILEKCQPLDIDKFKVTNTNSPLHWGQKYEPVSIMYYEKLNNTTVTEFGCIPHSQYSFIAASPDGIVCDKNSDLFGRMLEIKNVVSREINGKPKMEYWIQMQLQMEVCDLNECDFLETKFVEYTEEEEFENDNTTENKGIILQFCHNDSVHYEYAPLHVKSTKEKEYSNWYDSKIEINKEKTFVNTLFWKLEVISCVLVLRNKFWFSSILPSIEFFWNTILKEREDESYKLRIKDKKKLEHKNFKDKSDFPDSGCLINL